MQGEILIMGVQQLEDIFHILLLNLWSWLHILCLGANEVIWWIAVAAFLNILQRNYPQVQNKVASRIYADTHSLIARNKRKHYNTA